MRSPLRKQHVSFFPDFPIYHRHWRVYLAFRDICESRLARVDILHGGGFLSYHVNQSAGPTCRYDAFLPLVILLQPGFV
jgi:hypothetical protein